MSTYNVFEVSAPGVLQAATRELVEPAALASGGRLVVVGASDDPLQVAPVQLVFGDVHVEGSLTGRAIENEDNLKFAVHHGVAATIESRPLKEAPEAFAHMMNGDARFRVVLTA